MDWNEQKYSFQIMKKNGAFSFYGGQSTQWEGFRETETGSRRAMRIMRDWKINIPLRNLSYLECLLLKIELRGRYDYKNSNMSHRN